MPESPSPPTRGGRSIRAAPQESPLKEEGGSAPERQRSRPSVLALLLGFLAFAIVAFLVGYLLTSVLFFRGPVRAEVVAVPDLRGQTEADARRIIERAGLEIERGVSLVNPHVPEGSVLAQSPLPGQEVAPGTAVQVTLSAGRDQRRVPDVMAYSASRAEQFLTRAGFEVEVEERTDSRPAGRIVDVLPAPGTLVEVPGVVRLVVSTGPPREPVPLVVGLTEQSARETLASAGFRAGQIEYDPFALGPAGIVNSQRPAPGDSLPVGGAVNLIINGSAQWDQ